jgi:hypothetical protein
MHNERQAALEAARRLAARGGVIVLGNDIDLTLSTGGPLGEADPRKTSIRADSGEALRALEAGGHIIGIVTNRSGRQAARMLAERGVRAAEIVGTYGLETFHADASAPSLGVATVDARFALYAEAITTILRGVRETVYAHIGLHEDPGTVVELEAATPAGPLLIERKAVCDAFPEGLAHVYNVNLIADRPYRARLLARAEQRYRALAAESLAGQPLGRIWGLLPPDPPGATPRDARFSWTLGPTVARGKAAGMIALLRAARRHMADPARIGLVTFAGDSDADAAAMRAAHLVSIVAGRERIRALGIWARPAEGGAPLTQREADITVDGTDGYARLLADFVRAVE